MLRILFVDARTTYVNPTGSLILKALQAAGDVQTFGPGYVSPTDLHRGLTAFLRHHGPFDVIVADALFPTYKPQLADDLHRTYRQWRAGRYLAFGPDEMAEIPRIADEIRSMSTPKAVLLMGFDLYNFTREAETDFDQSWGMLIGPDAEMVPPLGTYEGPPDEFMSRANDVYHDFAARNRLRFLAFPHFVASNEFSSSTWRARRYDFSVPGQSYVRRGQVRAHLKRLEASVAPTRGPLVGKALSAAGLKPYGRKPFISWYRRTFMREIETSRAGYTCGSSVQFPVRKFFEIPALGAVLLCDQIPSLPQLGLIPGDNCLTLKDDRDLALVNEMMRAEPDNLATIAARGQELVRAKHSVKARGRQLQGALGRLAEDRWYGARLIQGDLIMS